MERNPCCAKEGLNRGAWTAQEDKILTDYLKNHGEGKWRNIPKEAGLKRCGKSCRLRWLNYLRPDIKRGNISPDEEDLIIRLHKLLGNRWSLIAGRLPGRTDNEIKNYWNTNLSKKQKEINNQNPTPPPMQSKNGKKKPSSFKLAKPSSVESSEVVKVKASKYNGMPLTKQISQPEDNDDDDPIAKNSSPDPIVMIPAADDSISKMTQTAEDTQSLSDFSVDFDMGEIILDHDFHQMGGDFDLGELNNHKVVACENAGFHNVSENNTGGSTFHDDELKVVCGMESYNGSSDHFDHHGDQTYAELQYLASCLGSSSSVEEWLGNDF